MRCKPPDPAKQLQWHCRRSPCPRWVRQLQAERAVVMDLFTRKPVEWAFSLSPDSELTAKALTMAYEARGRLTGVMFHSDQGSHYSNRRYRQQLWRYRIEQSMSRRVNCWSMRR